MPTDLFSGLGIGSSHDTNTCAPARVGSGEKMVWAEELEARTLIELRLCILDPFEIGAILLDDQRVAISLCLRHRAVL